MFRSQNTLPSSCFFVVDCFLYFCWIDCLCVVWQQVNTQLKKTSYLDWLVLFCRDMLVTGCGDMKVRVYYIPTSSDSPLKVFTGNTKFIFVIENHCLQFKNPFEHDTLFCRGKFFVTWFDVSSVVYILTLSSLIFSKPILSGGSLFYFQKFVNCLPLHILHSEFHGSFQGKLL